MDRALIDHIKGESQRAGQLSQLLASPAGELGHCGRDAPFLAGKALDCGIADA